MKSIKIKEILNSKISDIDKEKRIKEIESIPIYQKGKGLAIGNICSQILAIFYLNEVHHYIKEELKCKYFCNYMDDYVILSDDKEKLKLYKKLIENKFNSYKLSLNPKSNIYLVNNSFTFLGHTYHIYESNLVIKNRNVTKRLINKKLNYLKRTNFEKYFASLVSYQGYLGNEFIVWEELFQDVTRIYCDFIIIYDDGVCIRVVNDNNKLLDEFDIKMRYIKKIIKKLDSNNVKYVFLKKNRLLVKN